MSLSFRHNKVGREKSEKRGEISQSIRTTNHLERFFREFRNRADEIGAFSNETSCLTLFYVVMLRDHAKHQRFTVAKTLRH